MRIEDFTALMAKLAAAYREALTEATLEVYYEMLGTLDDPALTHAVQESIRTLKWFPKIAELAELADRFVERKALPLPRGPMESFPQSGGQIIERTGLLNMWQERDRKMRQLPPPRTPPTDEELAAHEARKAAAVKFLRDVG